MAGVEVHRVHFLRRAGEVGQRIAAAGGDGQQPRTGLQLQRVDVDQRVFPDLRVDQLAEPAREQPVAQRAGAGAAAVVDRLVDQGMGMHIASGVVHPGIVAAAGGRRVTD
ncbi:hypothetical protein D3C78_1666880 [compost metagenome]